MSLIAKGENLIASGRDGREYGCEAFFLLKHCANRSFDSGMYRVQDLRMVLMFNLTNTIGLFCKHCTFYYCMVATIADNVDMFKLLMLENRC